MNNEQKKIHKIATITGSDNGINIVIEHDGNGLFDLELYESMYLEKCFDWIDQRYSKVGNDGNYDLMTDKGAI